MNAFPKWITIPPAEWIFYAEAEPGERLACLIYEYYREPETVPWLALSLEEREAYTEAEGLAAVPLETLEQRKALRKAQQDAGGPRAFIFSDLPAARIIEVDGIDFPENSFMRAQGETDVKLRLNLELPTELLLSQIRSALDLARKQATGKSQSSKLAETRERKRVNELLRCLSQSRLLPCLRQAGFTRSEMTKEIGRVKVGTDPLGGTPAEWEKSGERLLFYFTK
jgi:hypothetical protein